MDFLKSQSGRLQQQFNQLTASQKMLSISLVIIMAMTLVWWGRYAGQAEMEPILDQDLAAEDLARVTADLRGRGIPFIPNGNRVLVPADRKYEILGSLMYQDIIPRDSSGALGDIGSGKGGSPFDSAEQQRDRRNDALQARLAAMIRGFDVVRNAMVVIDATEKRSFSNPILAKATVSIKMKPGKKADSRLVNAAADIVVGGVAGLKRSGVKVIVDGISRLSSSDDAEGGFGSGNWMDAVRESEGYYAEKLQRQLGYCEGAMVYVNVLPKEDSSETTEKTIDPKSVIAKETENEHETHTTGGVGQGSNDVGVGANTAANGKMTLSVNGEQASVMEKEKSKSQLLYSEKTRITRSPASPGLPTSASVGMPRSYFVKAYMSDRRTDKEPGEVVLADYIKNELEKCRAHVKVCLNLKSDDQVFVNTYTDLVPVATESLSQTASGVSLLMGNHGKEIVLGALALVSLFMVSMMVRKSGPALAMPSEGVTSAATGATVDVLLAKSGSGGGSGGKGAMKLTEEDAAEVGESGQTLDGVELDEETVRAQQVVEQVSTLVKENPDTAASLIKRWMNRV